MEAARRAGTAPGRLAVLDGLRGWAAVVVVLYHVFCDGLPPDPEAALALRLVPFNGVLAVNVFFVVSGFALSMRYLADGNIRPWARLAIGRIPRLTIPVLGGCALVFVALKAGWIAPPSERLAPFAPFLTFEPTLAHLLRFSLLDVLVAYDVRQSYIAPLWSIPVEFAGSALVLAAVVPARRLPPSLRAPLLVALAAIAYPLSPPGYAGLALLPLGAALADLHNRGLLRRLPPAAAWAAFAVGVALPLLGRFDVGAPTLVLAAVPPVIGALAAPGLRAVLETPLSRHLGRLSYPLYLMHSPVLFVIGEPLTRFYGMTLGARIAIDLALLPLCYAAAWLLAPVNAVAIALARRLGRALVPPRA